MILKTQNIDAFKGKDAITLECEYCHNDFQSTKKKYKRTFYTDAKLKYCSKQCQFAAQRTGTLIQCVLCGKETYRPVSQVESSSNIFCSQSCAATYNNRKHPKRISERRCRSCGELNFNKTSYFCSSECKEKSLAKYQLILKDENKLKNKKLLDVKKQNGFKENRYVSVRKNAKVMYKHYGLPHVCKSCGYDKHVEICHIKAINGFSDDALVAEINSIDNLIALCPNCHWEFDRGILTIL